MNFNFLDTLVTNIYDNCKLSQDDRSNLSLYRNVIINILKEKFINVEIINQGSYATFTQIITNDDLDVDIGIVFKNLKWYSKPNKKKQEVYAHLCNHEAIKMLFKPIEQPSRCCIKLHPVDIPNIKFEIAIYKNYYRKLYFGIGDEWKIDNKKYQMAHIKNILAHDTNIRKIIMFIKFYVSLNTEYKKIFKSIVILEMIIQNYENIHTNMSENMIHALRNIEKKLDKNFVLNISSNCREKENILNNEFRSINQHYFLSYLKNIIDDFLLISENKSLVDTSIDKIMLGFNDKEWNKFSDNVSSRLFSFCTNKSLKYFVFGHKTDWKTVVCHCQYGQRCVFIVHKIHNFNCVKYCLY